MHNSQTNWEILVVNIWVEQPKKKERTNEWKAVEITGREIKMFNKSRTCVFQFEYNVVPGSRNVWLNCRAIVVNYDVSRFPPQKKIKIQMPERELQTNIKEALSFQKIRL